MRTTTKRAGDAKKLRKLPAVASKAVGAAPARAGTPKKVVQNLQVELARLLARGYSVDEVGSVLRKAGIEVSAATLRGYARNASKRAGTAGAVSVKRKVVARKAPAKGRAPVAKAASAAAAPAPAPAPNAREFQLAKATFVVRPDTPDSDL